MSWAVIWTIFTAVFLVGFGVLEVIGLKTKGTAGTWSYWWWRLLFTDHIRTLNGQRAKRLRGPVWFVIGGTLVWVLIHFLTGGAV